jgi:hypothetical protein
LFTLAYIPNYFDILPMYLVMMVWLPIFWVLSRLHVVVALCCSAALYWATLCFGWELTADPSIGRPWYFNPFNWQWMFFAGYGLRGRLAEGQCKTRVVDGNLRWTGVGVHSLGTRAYLSPNPVLGQTSRKLGTLVG